MRRSSKLLLTLSALLLLLVAGTLDMGARVRSTRKNLRSTEVPVAVLDTVDGLLPDSLMTVDPAAVTIKGFAKRASDSKESSF